MDCSLPSSSVHGDSPVKNTGVGCHALFQEIFPTQGSNPGLPHFKQILYHLSNHAAAAAKSLQSCPTLCNPMDCSLPGYSIHGILQARTLEWVAISFSNAWKWKVKVKLLSHVQLLATPWTAAYQAPPSMGFSGQQYWSGAPLPSPAVILEPFKRKSNTDCPSICHKVTGSDAMILVFRMLSLKPMFYSPLSIPLSGSLVLPFCHKGGVICISEVISPGKLDSSLCLIQHSVSHEVPCIDVK